MTKPSARRLRWSLVLVPTLVACVSSGTAVGMLRKPSGQDEPVPFVWKSDASAPQRGQISGTLPDGTHYSGRYFQVMAGVEEVFAPAWAGWSPYWTDWPTPWSPGELNMSWPAFVRIYSGRVIANLESSDHKQRLRCRFEIDDPNAGLGGGGTGECQSSKGETMQRVRLAGR